MPYAQFIEDISDIPVEIRERVLLNHYQIDIASICNDRFEKGELSKDEFDYATVLYRNAVYGYNGEWAETASICIEDSVSYFRRFV